MTHFVVIFKKTTIKDDDARRKHVVQEEERKADASKKYKCKDYVVIGDPANELKKSAWMSSIKTSPACCCC